MRWRPASLRAPVQHDHPVLEEAQVAELQVAVDQRHRVEGERPGQALRPPLHSADRRGDVGRRQLGEALPTAVDQPRDLVTTAPLASSGGRGEERVAVGERAQLERRLLAEGVMEGGGGSQHLAAPRPREPLAIADQGRADVAHDHGPAIALRLDRDHRVLDRHRHPLQQTAPDQRRDALSVVQRPHDPVPGRRDVLDDEVSPVRQGHPLDAAPRLAVSARRERHALGDRIEHPVTPSPIVSHPRLAGIVQEAIAAGLRPWRPRPPSDDNDQQ
jgi:hypothetical protein